MNTRKLPLYMDVEADIEARVDDLVSRMTLDEKVSQMVNHAPAIDRLGIPAYDWWNECLHGVGRAGIATVFPQAIGLAATWDVTLVREAAVAISDEARAKHHDAVRRDVRDIYTGLTFWTPNINIFRDPRWGRGQETYGEDPYLTGRIGVEFIKGLQGNDPKYLKLAATAKHFAVHSGPESERHGFNAEVSEYDLQDTYLPAFKACVQEAKVESVMGAYNRTNGEACCASPALLDETLRKRWGFDGHVVSDCGAICDIWKHHHVAEGPAEAAALAVNNGCDLCCGDTYQYLTAAVEQGLITEESIDKALKRLFTTRFRLGMFDPDETVPYTRIPIEINDSPKNRALAKKAALESMVLLKNAGGLLPLKDGIKRIAVIGPNSDSMDVLLGNYNGTPSKAVTPLEGIKARAGAGCTVRHARGCSLTGSCLESIPEAIDLARDSDIAILCLGLSPRIEGEEGDSDGDRLSIALPGVQEELLKAVYATGTPVVLVLLNGSAIAINWADENIPAILEAWYPGEEGGTAIAEVLFGDYNPGGRLPVTFYRSVDQLPPFDDYSMTAEPGRTYRYFKGDPLYPFGYGLSYTDFRYSDIEIYGGSAHKPGETIEVTVDVTNTGTLPGSEVVEMYITNLDYPGVKAIRQLCGFTRIFLAPGETTEVKLTLDPFSMSAVGEDGSREIRSGRFTITVGGGQPGGSSPVAEACVCLDGKTQKLEV